MLLLTMHFRFYYAIYCWVCKGF